MGADDDLPENQQTPSQCDDCIGLVVIAAVVLITIGGSFLLGVRAATGWEHDKAIESRVGRWTVNEFTGEVKFVYGTPSKPRELLAR